MNQYALKCRKPQCITSSSDRVDATLQRFMPTRLAARQFLELRALSVKFQFEVRSKSHSHVNSSTNEMNCIVIGKPARIRGRGEEGVPLRIYQWKLIIHRKLNEHTRGFSASDQWSNLKEFMSKTRCMCVCVCVCARSGVFKYLRGHEDEKAGRILRSEDAS